MENFFETMKNTALQNEDFNVSITENGALGYATTGNKLIDLHFAVSSLRMKSEVDIKSKFGDAFYENPRLALLWLFYVRDVREGLGERRLFRVCLNNALDRVSLNSEELITELCELIAEYGRYDDIYVVFNHYPATVGKFFANQIAKDLANMYDNKPVSLLAKWLKSENASSKESKELARLTARYMLLTPRAYRQILSTLREYIDVVERKLSAKQFEEINYEKVPSQASLKYKEAFLRNDQERYQSYIDSVSKGEKKINANTLYPCDIVHQYEMYHGDWECRIKEFDATLEELWKALPNTVADKGGVLVVADGSGSMMSRCNRNSTMTSLDVANSLAIYFAERAKGVYNSKYITFSSRPQFVDFTNCRTLKEKIELALKYDECSNTDIEKVFDLILKTAVDNNLKQDELPEAVLVISDMEFNNAVMMSNNIIYSSSSRNFEDRQKRLFQIIAYKYSSAGYKLPKLIFWNVASRTGTIPIIENENGLVLVSGYSVNTIKMILNGELDPKKSLYEEITSKRYEHVDNLIRKIL